MRLEVPHAKFDPNGHGISRISRTIIYDLLRSFALLLFHVVRAYIFPLLLWQHNVGANGYAAVMYSRELPLFTLHYICKSRNPNSCHQVWWAQSNF